jgi:hypothetical protein
MTRLTRSFYRDCGTCLLAATVITGPGAANEWSPNPSVRPRIVVRPVVGYTDLHLDEVGDVYDAAVRDYRLSGIAISTQRRFPGNVLLGLEILRPVHPIVNVGVAGSYSWTRAFSLYGDPYGTLDIIARLRMFDIQALSEVAIPVTGPVLPFARFGAGAFRASLDLEDVLGLQPVQGGTTTATLSGHGWGVSVTAGAGIRFHVLRQSFVTLGGYRFATLNKFDAVLVEDGVQTGSGELDLEIDCSGPVAFFGWNVGF